MRNSLSDGKENPLDGNLIFLYFSSKNNQILYNAGINTHLQQLAMYIIVHS